MVNHSQWFCKTFSKLKIQAEKIIKTGPTNLLQILYFFFLLIIIYYCPQSGMSLRLRHSLYVFRFWIKTFLVWFCFYILHLSPHTLHPLPAFCEHTIVPHMALMTCCCSFKNTKILMNDNKILNWIDRNRHEAYLQNWGKISTYNQIEGRNPPSIMIFFFLTFFNQNPNQTSRTIKSHPSKHMGNKVSPQIIPPENDNLPPFLFSLRYWTVHVASPQMARGAGPALAFVE